MKTVVTLFFVLLLVFTVSSVSNAVTFEGTAVGDFLNVVSTDATDVYSVSNNDSGGVAAFNWGIPATTPFDNQFTFDGVGSDGGIGWSVDSEDPFVVGDFSYRNGSTSYSAGIDGVSLNINLTITDPLMSTDTYLFDFDITNTPNTTGNPVLDGDIVTVVGLYSNTIFSYLGVDYTLQLLGFSSDAGATIRTDFSSPEGGTANADLYARITSEISNPVPEPATMLLVGSGLIGLAGLSRKKFFKK